MVSRDTQAYGESIFSEALHAVIEDLDAPAKALKVNSDVPSSCTWYG